jgi:sec-independent protein translocase protein TatA
MGYDRSVSGVRGEAREMLGTWELILIVVVVILLFGAKRIPEVARGIGKGIKEFRKGLEGKEEGEGKGKNTAPKREDSNSPDDQES